MSDESEKKEDKPSLEDELSRIKQEMSDIKEILKQQRSEGYEDDNDELFHEGDPDRPRRRRRTRAFKPVIKVNFDEDDFDLNFEELERVSDTLGDYLSTVFEGVSDNLRHSVDQMARGFRSVNERTADSVQRHAERAIKHEERNIRHQMKRAKWDIDSAKRDVNRHRSSIIFKKLKGEELEDFYKMAPGIVGALSDARRLKLLKELEKQPLYQGDLSDKTEIKGGTFKHHMDALIQSKFVHQEKTRGRYLITQLGMEALKLAEMIYRRHTYELKQEKGEDIEVDIDEEEVDVDVDFEDVEADLSDTVSDLTDNASDSSDETEDQ